MKLTPLAANMTEVQTGSLKVLFSYKTPVAYFDSLTDQYYSTEQFWSQTTTRHINKWVDKSRLKQVKQDVLDNLLDGGK